MGKKILIGFTIILVSGLVTGWYFFSQEARYFGTSAFRAIPENSAAVIRIKRFGTYFNESKDNPIWKISSVFPEISTFYQYMLKTDSLIERNSTTKDLFKDKDLIITFGSEKYQTGNLFILELASLGEKRALADFTSILFKSKGADKSEVTFKEAKISVYNWKENKEQLKLFVTFYHGLFIAGLDEATVVQSINQTDNLNSINPVFEKATKTATAYIDLNIYLNHNRLQDLTAKVLNSDIAFQIAGSAPFANWSEIDLSQKNDEILLNGFSFTSNKLINYLEVFLHQKPGVFSLANHLPAETSFFLGFVIDNLEQYFKDYQTVLEKEKRLKLYLNGLNAVNSVYNVDLQRLLIENTDREVAMVFTKPGETRLSENKFLVIKIKSESEMMEGLTPMIEKPERHGKKKEIKYWEESRIDDQNILKIYKFKIDDFGKRLFGEIFSKTESTYFTIFENILLMGSSVESLGNFVRSNVLNEILTKDKNYIKTSEALSANLNCFLWCNPDQAYPFIKDYMSEDLVNTIDHNRDLIPKIESFGWQLFVENGMIYNMARVKCNPDAHRQISSILWKLRIGNTIKVRPQFIADPQNNGKFVIAVQDSSNNFMVVNDQGHVLWKFPLEDRILGCIHMIQRYSGKSRQYLFNTKDALYLVDANGNLSDNFPIKFKSPATNGVVVFDYENDKNYRLFVASADHKICLYDKNGKPIADWKPARTENDVLQPVQYFRVASKDYLVYKDGNSCYIVDRKGRIRVPLKGGISYSENPFTLNRVSSEHPKLISTDSKGGIVSINFDGSIERRSFGQFSSEHFFIFEDINSDKISDYVYCDRGSIMAFNQKGEQIFNQKLNALALYPPVYKVFQNKSPKIGICSASENMICLFNSNGTQYHGFPIPGNSMFDIQISEITDHLSVNVVVGSADGYLNFYEIKN